MRVEVGEVGVEVGKMRVEVGARLVERRAEDRELLVQIATHTNPLGALAGEHERHGARFAPSRVLAGVAIVNNPPNHARRGLSAREILSSPSSSSLPSPKATARCPSAGRAVSEKAMSTASSPGACRANCRSPSARACRPATPRPEMIHGSTQGSPTPPFASARPWGVSGWGALSTVVGASSGASSRITCALVPPTPNEETAARRGFGPRSHGTSSASSDTAPADQSTWRWRVDVQGLAAAPRGASPSPS